MRGGGQSSGFSCWHTPPTIGTSLTTPAHHYLGLHCDSTDTGTHERLSAPSCVSAVSRSCAVCHLLPASASDSLLGACQHQPKVPTYLPRARESLRPENAPELWPRTRKMPSAIATSPGRQHGSLVNGNGGPHESTAVESGASHSSSIPSHPLGVKPLGNRYLSTGPNARASVGTWAILPDEMLTVVLEHLEKSEVLNLGSTCKFFYAFCHPDELWKSLFLG